jgi:excalibur calcium-binding domain-containing protein
MRAIVFLLAAVILGLTGGYAWSKWSKPSAAKVAMAQAQAIPSAKPGQTKADIEETEYYADCDAAHAAGKEPLYEGQPGYRAELDPDGDGMACIPTS